MEKIEICENKYGWYVSRSAGDKNKSYLYLHKNGKWRTGTDHDGKFTGYFSSREEAEEMFKRYPR